jgi:hypothetical protein
MDISWGNDLSPEELVCNMSEDGSIVSRPIRHNTLFELSFVTEFFQGGPPYAYKRRSAVMPSIGVPGPGFMPEPHLPNAPMKFDTFRNEIGISIFNERTDMRVSFREKGTEDHHYSGHALFWTCYEELYSCKVTEDAIRAPKNWFVAC